MAKTESLNIALTDEMKKFVASQSGNGTLYSTPSEYVRDLIRHERDQINTDNKMNKPPDDLKIPIIHSGNTSDSGHQTDSNSGSNPMTPNRFSFSSSFQIDNENSGEEEDDEETQEDEIMVFENSFEDDLE